MQPQCLDLHIKPKYPPFQAMRKWFVLLATFFIATFGSMGAFAQDFNEAALIKAVTENSKGAVKPDAIRRSPIPGVFEVKAGAEIIYVDKTGRYAFVENHLIDLVEAKDLTASRLEEMTTIDFESLPLDKAIVTVRGKGSRRLAVFEDPYCMHCRTLRKLLSQIDDVTIYAFPISLQRNDGFILASAAMCAANKTKAWEAVMTTDAPNPTGKAATAECKTTVASFMELADKGLNIKGTPTVFLSDGRRIEGAVPAHIFMAKLDGLREGKLAFKRDDVK
jgi:thiol:disulfide interchange protein DsbC